MRETIKLTTKSGAVIEYYSFITGGESREISNVFLRGIKLQLDENGKPKSNEINAELASEAQDMAIKKLVVSVNGIKENVLEAVLNLPKSDFDEVLSGLDKVQNGLSEEKKTN